MQCLSVWFEATSLLNFKRSNLDMICENNVIFTIEKGFVFVHLKGNSELKHSFLFFIRLGCY